MPLAEATTGKLETTCFLSEQMFEPHGAAKEVFSPEETARHANRRRGHLGSGIPSAGCDRRPNYTADPSDPFSFKAACRPNVAGENRWGKVDVRVK